MSSTPVSNYGNYLIKELEKRINKEMGGNFHVPLLDIPTAFFNDSVNTSCLPGYVKKPKRCRAILMNVVRPSEAEMSTSYFHSNLQRYFLTVHARYVRSPRGLSVFSKLYSGGSFGYCDREGCTHVGLIPWGDTEVPGGGHLKSFCPKCQEVYNPSRYSNLYTAIDGCAYGPNFAAYFILITPENAWRKRYSFFKADGYPQTTEGESCKRKSITPPSEHDKKQGGEEGETISRNGYREEFGASSEGWVFDSCKLRLFGFPVLPRKKTG